MKHIALSSRALAKAGYCPDRRCLEVVFHDGTTWAFQDVPPVEIEYLRNGPSAGQHLQLLKQRYRCERCGPKP